MLYTIYYAAANGSAEAMPGWVMPLMMVLLGTTITMGMAWFLKYSYAKDLKPTKKHKHGQLVCTFHPNNGRPYSKLLSIEDNGHSVKAPSNKYKTKLMHYEFDKDSLETIPWPPSPFLGITLLCSDAPRVNWWENDPNPIKKKVLTGYLKDDAGEYIKDDLGNKIPVYQEPEPLLTSERIDEITDDAALEAQNLVEEELTRHQEELRRALANQVNKNLVYIGLAITAMASVVGAFLIYNLYQLYQTGGL